MAQSLLQKVRDSCQFVVLNAKHVKISSDSINSFVENLSLEELSKKTEPIHFPLKFDNAAQEIALICVLDLINFGSGFRNELHNSAGRGAYDTMTYGVLGLHLSKGWLTAKLMAEITLAEVAEYFQLQVMQERKMDSGIYVGEPTALRALADKITQVLNSSGKILLERGFKSFADFILAVMATPAQCTAENIVQSLVSVFPAFADVSTYQGQQIFLLKKAQLLAADLHRRFKDHTEGKFRLADIDSLTAFTDNVVGSVLQQFGILQYDQQLSEKIASGKALPSGDEEVEIRACAIVACEHIVQAARAHPKYKNIGMNSMLLDYYLWTKGKDPQFRAAHRHYTQDTIYY